MRQPLDGFADRIIRCQEVREFIQGLIEKGVDPEVIISSAVVSDSTARVVGKNSKGFLAPLPGADPHDPDGGHDNVGH